jgi:L-alanine-DL-glutamate epimerase-like enolase superfamily enzyme
VVGEVRRLRRLRWGTVAVPLKRPYELSFTRLSSYDCVWVLAEDLNRNIGVGEAVPLPGYNWETLDTIRTAIAALTGDAEGENNEAIVARCRRARAEHPFAASAVMTALDMPAFVGHAELGERFPLSAAVSGETPVDELSRAVATHLASGYGYIKVKVGRDLNSDMAAAKALLRDFGDRRFGVVFDANQAYPIEQAMTFARALSEFVSDRLQWFEQPVDRRDWRAMERLCQAQLAPIVLDECIYDEADVVRAAAIGAHGIKLKLVKNFGIAEVLALARRARESGLIVVFGNGVATDLGNLGEYLALSVGKGLFTAPGECSGFAKLRNPLLGKLLGIDEQGRMFCSAGDEIRARIADFPDRGTTNAGIERASFERAHSD